jgi:hypothetical protein
MGPVDPTSPRVDVVDPTGHLSTFSGVQITRVSTGVYNYTIDTTGEIGRWSYRWWSPPPIGAAGQSTFIVDPFPNP